MQVSEDTIVSCTSLSPCQWLACLASSVSPVSLDSSRPRQSRRCATTPSSPHPSPTRNKSCTRPVNLVSLDKPAGFKHSLLHYQVLANYVDVIKDFLYFCSSEYSRTHHIWPWHNQLHGITDLVNHELFPLKSVLNSVRILKRERNDTLGAALCMPQPAAFDHNWSRRRLTRLLISAFSVPT